MVTNNSGPRTQVRGLWSLYSTNCTVLHTVLLQYTHTPDSCFVCFCVYAFCAISGRQRQFFAYLIPSMEAWNHLTRPTCVPPCSIAFQYKEYDPKRMIRMIYDWSVIMSNSLKAQEFGEKQLSAVCAKKPGSFCPEVCMVIPPVFITLPT